MLETVLGAIIGGSFAIGGAWAQAALQQRRREKAISSAIGSEIATLIALARANEYGLRMRWCAEVAEKEGQPVNFLIPASANYFGVYEANAGEIGHLPDRQSARIIAFYQATRSWLETMTPGAAQLSQFQPAEQSQFLRMMADRLDRLCEMGDELSAELCSPATSVSIGFEKRRLLGLQSGDSHCA